MNKRWRPSVTVAAVIEHEGRFLLVEERTPEGLKLNNPAGHLEPGETPEAAVVREALEETGREFVPEALLGVYMARFVRPRPARPPSPGRGEAGANRPPEDTTYLRFAYRGRVGEPLPERVLDPAIVRTLWLTREEIAAAVEHHRSPLLMQCIDDHLAGRRLPLDSVQGHASLVEPVVLQPIEPPPRSESASAPPGTARAPQGAVGDAQRPSRSARRRAQQKMRRMQENENSANGEGMPPVAEHGQDAADAGAGAGAGAVSGTPSALAEAPTNAAASEEARAEGGAAPQAPAPAAPAPAGTGAPPRPPEPTLAETTAALAERFPALFALGQPRPIKLRIQADIQARSQGAFTRKQLSIFLHRHTTSTAYLRALVATPQRFDLDGLPAGEVAPEHLEAAKVELERRRQIVMQRRAGSPAGRPMGRAVAPAATGGDEAPAEGAPTADAQPQPRETGRREGPPLRPNGPGRADRPPRQGGEGRSQRPPHADGPGRPMRTDRPPRPDRHDRPDRPDRRERSDRPPPRHFDGPRPPRPAAPEPNLALPEDPERRERAILLRSFEGSPLTAANYCALKGLALAEFEAQIAQARREREERQRAAAGAAH